MPKVSVIVPIYGVEKYIERCAKSLFEQTLDDIEFIFINDCTPDRSMVILEAIVENNRIRLTEKNWTVRTITMPCNSGLPAVRKRGIELSQGEYVIACDSDDYVDREMYEKMYNYAIENNLDLVHCDIEIVDREKSITVLSYSKDHLDSDELRELIINGDISNSLCNKMVRRRVFIDNGIKYPQYNIDEDNVVSIQLAAYSKKLGYMKTPFYHAYFNRESMSRINGDEQMQKKYNDSLSNSIINIEFLKSIGYKNTDYAVIKAKNRPKMVLWPIKSYKYAKLWRNTYREINYRILFQKRVSYKLKLIYLLVLTGLYPVYNLLFCRK